MVNHFTVSGRVGNNTRISEFDDGNMVANFSLANNERSGDKEFTSWIRCVAWGGHANVIRDHCETGKQLTLQGRIKSGSYMHKDGYKVYTTELVVSRIDLGESAKGQRETAAPAENPAEVATQEQVPF